MFRNIFLKRDDWNTIIKRFNALICLTEFNSAVYKTLCVLAQKCREESAKTKDMVDPLDSITRVNQGCWQGLEVVVMACLLPSVKEQFERDPKNFSLPDCYMVSNGEVWIDNNQTAAPIAIKTTPPPLASSPQLRKLQKLANRQQLRQKQKEKVRTLQRVVRAMAGRPLAGRPSAGRPPRSHNQTAILAPIKTTPLPPASSLRCKQKFQKKMADRQQLRKTKKENIGNLQRRVVQANFGRPLPGRPL